MSRSLLLYRSVEAVIGRSRAARLGRWLYLGSRRELTNDPDVNGEYALQTWALEMLGDTHPSERTLCFVDVGANVGDWTASLIGKLSPIARPYVVHAFEPAPGQHAILGDRLREELAAGRVVVHEIGLAASPGKAAFEVTGDVTGNSSIARGSNRAEGSIEIAVTTLDDAFPDHAAIDLIKVDTEGNDFNVIVGGTRLFDASSIRILQFEYNWRWIDFGHTLKSVFEFLADRPYVLGKLTAEGLEIYGAWHFELDRYIETNYVIVRADLLHALPHQCVTIDSSNLPRLTNP